MKKGTLIQFYLNYRLYIFPAMVALSSLFLIIFAIYPQTAKLIENQKAVGDLTNKTKILATKVSALESFSGEDLSQKAEIALNSIPADKDYGSIIGVLQRIVAQSGFTISSFALGNSGKLGNASSFEIKLDVRGPKNLFQIFLQNLESSPRLMRVTSIDVSSIQIQEIISAGIVIEVLYSPTPQTFGTVDSPLPSLSQSDENLLVALSRTSLPASSSAGPFSPRGKSNPFE